MLRAPARAAILALGLAISNRAAPAHAQHPGGPWRTLETTHFRVHVRPAHRDLGLRAAAEAEAAWTQLAVLLPPPRGKVDLVVADNVDDANGFATIYPTPTIVVYAFPPAGDIQLATYDRWLRLVVVHELVHIFHLDLARGWWGVARTVFGRVPALFPNEYAPTWLVEGTAVFLESRLTAEGRLEGAFHRAIVDAQVAERGRLPMGSAGAISPRWPGGVRAYAFGGSFLGAVANERGDSVVPRLVHAIARRPLPYLQLNGALNAAGKVRFSDAWRVWMDSLQAHSRTAAQPHSGDSARTVLCCQRTASVLRASADGQRLLFVHNDGTDVPRLAVWDRGAGAARMIARVNGDNGFAWLGGDSVLFAQPEFTDAYTLRSDLWAADLGGGERRLTRQARLREPDAGPDGAVVAVRSVPGSNELVARAGDSVRVIVPAVHGIEWSAPRFARDGRGLVAVRVVNGRHDVVFVDVESGRVTVLTSDAATDRAPAWTPSGRLLVWSREVDGRAQIVAFDPATGATAQLTRERFGAYAPAPTDDSLFYFAYHADGFRLVATDLAGEPLALDSTPAAAPAELPAAAITAEHGYRPFPALWPHYWMPSIIATGQGEYVGAFTSGGDPLRRHAYVLDAGLGINGQRGRWRGLFYYSYAGVPPLVLDVAASRSQSSYWADTGGVTQLRCCLTDDAVDAGVTIHRRCVRSALLARVGGEYERTEAFAQRSGVSLTLSASRVRGAAQAISTQGGGRVTLQLRHRWNQTDRTAASDVVASGAVYVRATRFAFANQVLALRGSAGTISGTDRVNFGVGGVAGGVFEALPGVFVGGGARTFPVRGYPASYLVGRSALGGALEFRSPLVMVGGGPGLFPPVTLDRVSTAVFADLGVAWGGRYCADPPGPAPADSTGACARSIGSAGGELVFDAGIPYDFPVRLRVGAAWRFGLKSPAAFAAVGAAF